MAFKTEIQRLLEITDESDQQNYRRIGLKQKKRDFLAEYFNTHPAIAKIYEEREKKKDGPSYYTSKKQKNNKRKKKDHVFV
jgi:hypothetical protein